MIGWLDCASGASGDMLLGAVVDAGVPLKVLESAVAAVAPEPVGLSTERVSRAGLAAVRVRVDVEPSSTGRTWSDLRDVLTQARLSALVRDRALATFARLADAEAKAHGVDAGSVHFHEVGALDAIADVVGVCAGLVHLDLSALRASPVALGSGTTITAHGTLPVPPPAVVELLRGAPTYGGGGDVELCTPTGAALLAEWVTGWGSQPAMTVTCSGTGAGGRDLAGQPNVVRLLLGEPTGSVTQPDSQLMLETNVDDLDPRLWPGVLSQILAAGAADAWLTPILMKKGRPAHMLSVLVAPERATAVQSVIFTETSAIGLRQSPVAKLALDRTEQSVEIDGSPVRVKIAWHGGIVVNVQPEYDDLAAVAAATGRPVKVVLAQAVGLVRELW